jgi:tRNA dimethylallyltransferase
MVLSVVGPTATGKTAYAFNLAEQLIQDHNLPLVSIISADSRQVYQGLEIVSGADIPANFSPQSYAPGWPFAAKHFFEKGKLELHGVSCIRPDTEWSLAHFQRFAHKIIADTWNKNGAVIIVGGTGLYHTRLFSTELQTKSGPDQKLRKQSMTKSLSQLQTMVKEKSATFFEEMTVSDQHNPRRLIRAIEQLQNNTQKEEPSDFDLVSPSKHQIMGLTDSIENIESKIQKRVIARLKNGAIQEVEQLTAKYADQTSLAIFSATGVKEIIAFLQEKISKEELEELWIRRERQYAKRQLTWWKKHHAGLWLDADTLLAIDQTT